jgi:hypothetical protein
MGSPEFKADYVYIKKFLLGSYGDAVRMTQLFTPEPPTALSWIIQLQHTDPKIEIPDVYISDDDMRDRRALIGKLQSVILAATAVPRDTDTPSDTETEE